MHCVVRLCPGACMALLEFPASKRTDKQLSWEEEEEEMINGWKKHRSVGRRPISSHRNMPDGLFLLPPRPNGRTNCWTMGELPISQSSVILFLLPVSSRWLVRPFIRLVDFFYAAVRLLYISPGRVEMSSPVRSTVKKEQESWWVHDWPTNKGERWTERDRKVNERSGLLPSHWTTPSSKGQHKKDWTGAPPTCAAALDPIASIWSRSQKPDTNELLDFLISPRLL